MRELSGYFSRIKTELRMHSGLTAKHRDQLIEFMLNINFLTVRPGFL